MAFGFPRLGFLLCIVIGATLPAAAETLQERLAACQTISDPVERLSCFENLANEASEAPLSEAQSAPSVTQATTVEPATNAVTSTPAPAIASVQTAPALPARKKPVARPKPAPQNEVNRYEGLVRKAQYDATGKLLVQLTNGEIWKQTSRGQFRIPPVGSSVRVRKSFSGAWFLKFDHDGRESRMVLTRYSD